jgi:hypothetical protein
MQEQLTEEQKKVAELEARGADPANDDELAQQMQESQQEIERLNKVYQFNTTLTKEN